MLQSIRQLRQVRQCQRLTWLRQRHACSVLALRTPKGVRVEIFTVTGTNGEQRVAAATPMSVRVLEEGVDVATLAVMIESLPGSSYEEE